jgi:RNA polymerase sigma-70 factor (ECF subfamily)
VEKYNFQKMGRLPEGPAVRDALPRGEERSLLAAARAGDRRAMRRLLERVSRPIFRFGRGFCRNTEDAEDVLQETLASLVRSLPSFRGDASLTTWAYTVARNACLRHRRRAGGAGIVSLDAPAGPDGDGGIDLPDQAPDPARALEQQDLDRALQHAILALPPALREVLLLRDVEGLPAGEVARALRLRERAVKSRLHRARLAVRDALRPLVEDEVPGPAAPLPRTHCPDTARFLSRHVEGELDAARCEALAAHVERCSACDRACRELRRSLAVCRRFGTRPVPGDVRAAVRRAIHAVLSASVPSAR